MAEALKGEKTLEAEIVSKISGTVDNPGPKRKAHMAWKALCDLENELLQPVQQRIRLYDRALVAYDDEQRAIARRAEQEAQRLAQQEDEERRIAEAAFLEEEATATGRDDLRERAEQLLTESAPVRTHVPASTPKVAGVGFRERYVASCDNLEALVKAIAGPLVLRDVAEKLRNLAADKRVKGATTKLALNEVASELVLKANTMPQIPVDAVCARENWLTKQANLTDISKWPGVKVEREKKTSARRS